MNLNDFATDFAEEFLNNHASFTSFGWHDAPEDREEWGMFYTHNRDSDILDQSNASQIDEALSEFDQSDARQERHGHWGCGWMEGWVVRVYTTPEHTEFTAAFLCLVELKNSLEEYPVLNEEDFSERESIQADEDWSAWGADQVRGELVAHFGLTDTTADWLDDGRLYELYSRYSSGTEHTNEVAHFPTSWITSLKRNQLAKWIVSVRKEEEQANQRARNARR